MASIIKKKATLSDTENLGVGALGGMLETCIQSTFVCSLFHSFVNTFIFFLNHELLSKDYYYLFLTLTHTKTTLYQFYIITQWL